MPQFATDFCTLFIVREKLGLKVEIKGAECSTWNILLFSADAAMKNSFAIYPLADAE